MSARISLARIHLSTPHMGGDEARLLEEAFRSNWIAPLGPQVEAFEQEFAEAVGARHALALSSGTAALHLALLAAGIGPGDEVLVSSLTFIASVNPIRYVGAVPGFIDSDPATWNLDPGLLEDAIRDSLRRGQPPGAVIPVHLYGQSADLDPILALCARHGIPVIEDAAEALGARYHGRQPGTFGKAGVFSFNGNKIITTSGGGMLVTDDERLVAHARKLATQARDLAPHYEHSEVGYNYRLSNLLAAVGRGQMRVLEERVTARRLNFEFYRRTLGDLPGVHFMPEAGWGRHTRWLTTLTIDPAEFGATREQVRRLLEAENIESRPVWKPMHLQPVFSGCRVHGGAESGRLFEQGLCLPSGSNLTTAELQRVADAFRAAWKRQAA